MRESLYDQIKLTLLLSELTYTLSLVRELARRSQLDGEDNLAALKIPMNAAEFQRIIKNNPNLLAIFEGQNEDANMQFSAVDQMKEEEMKRMTKYLRSSIRDFRAEMGCSLSTDRNVIDQHSEVVLFKDQSDKGYREQTQMVFGITVNRQVYIWLELLKQNQCI
jgi:hypothetical protein